METVQLAMIALCALTAAGILVATLMMRG